jgi:hypothetical protein
MTKYKVTASSLNFREGSKLTATLSVTYHSMKLLRESLS